MIFATVLGYVANIVSNISAARKDFQGRYYRLYNDCIQCILAEMANCVLWHCPSQITVTIWQNIWYKPQSRSLSKPVHFQIIQRKIIDTSDNFR